MSRLLVSALAVACLIAPTNLRAADDDPKAILTKAIKAHGGEEFLTKHPAGQAKNKGKITIAGAGELDFTQDTSYMLPDRLKDVLELTVGGQKITVVTIVVGDKITIENNGTAVPTNDQVKAAMVDMQYLMKVGRIVPLLKEKGFDLAAAGEIKVDEKPAIGVRVSSKGRKDVTLYFDKTTGLSAKAEHRVVDGATGNELTEERIIREYKKNDAGIPFPSKVTVKRDGKDYVVADVVEIKLLEKLEDSAFAK
jgi:hypothetical protein